MGTWRVVLTDSESLTGVAPVCPQTEMKHVVRLETDLSPYIDEAGVYDCCPGPHIECFSEPAAHNIAQALSDVDAEVCA